MRSDRFRPEAAVCIALCALVAANALWFTATTAIPVPASDAWYFIDTFVRKAVEGHLQVADYFDQRRAGDHAQPLHRLVLLGHLRLADLDFRIEAVVGIALATVTCAIYALLLVRGATSPRQRWFACLGAVALFAVGLSLNATIIYTWSLVSLIWISLLAAVAYWREAAAMSLRPKLAPLVAPTTLAVGLALDELALPAFAAAVVALLVRDGWRRPRPALEFAAWGGLGLAAARWLIHAMAAVGSAADATGGKLGGLLQLLEAPEAWKLVVAPLSDSLVHREHLASWFPQSVVQVQWLLAAVLAALHVLFWWRAFGRQRPRDAVLVVAVATMLFFYAAVGGVALSRATQFGIDYVHQPRYASVYALNVVALLLMFLAPVAGADGRPWRLDQKAGAGLAIVVLLLQVPLNIEAYKEAPFIRRYAESAASALVALGQDPDQQPTHGCPPILTVCRATPEVRERTMQLLQQQRLSVYSPGFRRAYGYGATDGAVTQASFPAAIAPAACNVTVLRRGPTRITQGQSFNRQPDGRSAFWLQVPPSTPAFDVLFDGERLRTARRDGVVTFAFDARQAAVAASGAPLRFDLSCGGKPVGGFEVEVR